MDNIAKAIQNLLEINLGIKKNERILIFTDLISTKELDKITHKEFVRRKSLQKIAWKVYEIAKDYGKASYLEYEELKYHGCEPPKELWEVAFGKSIYNAIEEKGFFAKIINKTKDKRIINYVENIVKRYRKEVVEVIIGLANYSTSHTKFRDLLVNFAETRFASMPLFEPEMLFTSLNINWESLEKETLRLSNLLSNTKEMIVTSPNGTFLRLNTKDRKVFSDTGILNKPGSFGNLPAGEVYLAPNEGLTEGKLVIEWAPTFKLKSPIELIIKKGEVVDIQGKDKYKRFLNEKFHSEYNSSKVAELGIGTNEKATKIDNIIESEKIKGTIHIAFGDNSAFGGRIKANFHQDYIIFNPTLKATFLDGKEQIIVENGKTLY
ncbi:MAG: aminopeptidase [bacterium]|nr:aminopeptidase [bacterium]